MKVKVISTTNGDEKCGVRCGQIYEVSEEAPNGGVWIKVDWETKRLLDCLQFNVINPSPDPQSGVRQAAASGSGVG